MLNLSKLALGGALIGCLSLAPIVHAVTIVEVEPVLHEDTGCGGFDDNANKLDIGEAFERVPELSSTDAINGIPGVIRNGTDGIAGGNFWAGNLPKMTDGMWTQANDDDANSWNMGFETEGDPPIGVPRFVQWDLGEVQAVSEVNIYTRHCNTRSAQIQVIYGSNAAIAPDIDLANGLDPLLEDLGWEFIAFVDSQTAPEFLADPPEPGFEFLDPGIFDGYVGSSVFDDAGGSIGDFRYILVQVLDVGAQEEAYVEFDVVTTSVAPDPDVDNDGDVDGADFLAIQRDDPSLIPAWEAQYGTSNPLVAAAAVPEPGTLVLSTLAMLAWVIPGRRRRS